MAGTTQSSGARAANGGWGFIGTAPGRLVLALAAALLLLTGVLNVRAVFGDGANWAVDPAAPSEVDALVGAPERRETRLDGQIRALQDELRANDGNAPAATLLGQAYLQKARETGDPSYYPKAEQLFRRALDANANDHEALVGLGTLALARHHFADALSWGERARDVNPYHAPAYGVIGDAQIELGRYDEAVATIQQMVDLRPDLASYSRVSYARELMGDREGAIAAMAQAGVAGAAHAENIAWTKVLLGNLSFDGGDLTTAEQRYAEAQAVLPGYVYALAGQARVAAARGDVDEAATLYEMAVQTTPLPEFVIAYGDVLAAAGQAEAAAAQYALVGAIQQLYVANGVDTDLELALFTADHGDAADLPAALADVRAEVAARPSVVAYDTLAWLLYRNGDFGAAREASQQALRLGTKSALMHFHAGMIEAALDNRTAAIAHLSTAFDLNPHFSLPFAPEARATLDRLIAEEAAR